MKHLLLKIFGNQEDKPSQEICQKQSLTWEDVSKFEEIKGYGQHVWRHHEKYFFVTDEGGIAEQRVVYELPLELFQSPYQVFLSYLKSLT